MKRLIALLMILLLPLPALAAVPAETIPPVLKPDSPAAQCLEALVSWGYEDTSLCLGETGELLITFSGERAFAAVRTEDSVALCCFCQDDGEWETAWVNDYHPFGVDAAGADRQPEYLRFNGDTLTWMVVDEAETVEITATYDNWEWYVTGLNRHALVDGKWQLAEQRDEVIAVLAGFTMHQEGEPEPVVIEGNKLVSYPAERMDTHYTVPEGVEIIGEYAFSDNDWLVHVSLPESVRIIEEGAFADCYNLRRVDMPSTLESLGEGAFSQTYVNCVIPEGLTELPHVAFASAGMEGAVVIPEGVTDIGWECFAFGLDITDLYLPASLQTIGGQTFQQGAIFFDMWDYNSVDAGETHMTVHAPAGTEAARFATWSGESYVIEDAREGTDLAAVTAWVQASLDAEVSGAVVLENAYGFPLVTYSADTVFAFAMKETPGSYCSGFDGLLCCFDRVGKALTLRWVNGSIRSTRYRNAWDELDTPITLELVGDSLYLGLRGDEENAVFLTFSGEDFRLTELESCYWEEDTGGPPAYWATILRMPVTDGQPLQEFTMFRDTIQEWVVQGAVFDGDTVLLSLYDVIEAAGLDFTYESYLEGIARFEVGDVTYVLDEQAMTLTCKADEEAFNLILPAPGSTDFHSEIIDGRWMVDSDTVYVTFRTFLNWPIRINIDHDTQTVTVCAE